MEHGALEHVLRQIESAPMRTFPFPHIYVESVFPPAYYAELRRNWPNASSLVPLGSTGRVPEGAYPERFIMPLVTKNVDALPDDTRAFWRDFAQWMLNSNELLLATIGKFEPYLRARLFDGHNKLAVTHEALIVRDHSNYKLGPHTDAPAKVLSVLFYCPEDDRHSHLGTSIYTPVEPDFRCAGGPHHGFEKFEKVSTMQFKPNALFAFVKTDTSFHGVDPIRDADVLRDLILYDIRLKQ